MDNYHHRQNEDNTQKNLLGSKEASSDRVGDSQRVFAAGDGDDGILESINWADTKYLGPVKD